METDRSLSQLCELVMEPIMSQMNPVTSSFNNIHFNIILPLKLDL